MPKLYNRFRRAASIFLAGQQFQFSIGEVLTCTAPNSVRCKCREAPPLVSSGPNMGRRSPG